MDCGLHRALKLQLKLTEHAFDKRIKEYGILVY